MFFLFNQQFIQYWFTTDKCTKLLAHTAKNVQIDQIMNAWAGADKKVNFFADKFWILNYI